MSFPDEIYRQVPRWDQEAVRAARVLVVGAGALGNEVLKNLALLNVQQIAVMDLDHVEASNLSRSVLFRASDAEARRAKAAVAAERLLELNADLRLLTLVGDVGIDLGWALLDAVDVVVGCLDNRLARLYLNRWCWRAGKPWIDGGILHTSGQLSGYVPGHSCYECGLGPQGWQEIRQRMGCTDMARRYALDGHAATTPIAASLIGAMQVQEALKLVLGQQEQSIAGQTFTYEGAHLHAATYTHKPLRAACESHWQRLEPLPVPLSHMDTLGALWAWLGESWGLKAPRLRLDHSLATRVAGLGGGKERRVILPLPHFSDRIAAGLGTSPGEVVAATRGAVVEHVGPGDLPDGAPLWTLGIPAGQALRIDGEGDRRWVWLAGDGDLLAFRPGVHGIPNPWTNTTAADLASHWPE